MTGKKHRKKIRILPMILAAFFIFILIIAAVILEKKVSSTRQDADLESYYRLTADASAGLDLASDDELAIVMDGVIIASRARCIGGHYYISQDTAEEYVDERLYYGEEDGILLLTNAETTYKAYCGETSYSTGGEESDLGCTVFTLADGTAYISLEYLMLFSDLEYSVYEDPARVVITLDTGTFEYCDAASDTRMRTGAYSEAGVIYKVPEGTALRILNSEDYEDWILASTEEGWVGYVAADDVSQVYTQNRAASYTDPEYTSLSTGESVVIGFAGIYTSSANSTYPDITEYAQGTMNVYCPLWYCLSDDEDNFDSISSSYYTELAHSDDCLVWAVFTDTDRTTGENFGDDVLQSYEKRQVIIDAVIADMEANGIDGLNMDFECVSSGYSEDYLQFLRELSLRCREAGLYFTADNYAPYEYNDTIFSISEQNDLCDYVIIMAYDDYVGTGEAGPNSSTPFLKEVLELSLEKIDAGKLIVALPFYNRFWYEQDGTLVNEALSYETSWETIEEAGGAVSWDEELGVYYGEYTSDAGTVQAWLEGEASYTEKLDILSECSLAGVGFWRLGWGTEELWQLISTYY